MLNLISIVVKTYLGRIYLQHTRIAVTFALKKFLLFFSSKKKNQNIPTGKCDGYTSMLQMNAPVVLNHSQMKIK